MDYYCAGYLLPMEIRPSNIGAVCSDALKLLFRLAASGVQLPQYFLLMLPYAVTLGVMIWSSLSDRRDMIQNL